MPDLGGIKGDVQPPEPSGPKRKQEIAPQNFREKMKVGKVDPEEKKKKKHKTETEEEVKAAQAGKKPSQGLETTFEEPSPYTPKPTAEAPPPTTANLAPPSPATVPPPVSAPTEPSEPTAPQEPETTATPTEKKEQAAPAAKKEAAKKKPAEKLKPKAQEKPEERPSAPKETTKPVEESKEALLKQIPPEKREEKEKAPSPEEVVVPPPPLPAGAWEAATEKTVKKEEEKIAPEMASSLQPDTHPEETPLATTEITPTETPPVFSKEVSPQIMQIFEKIAGVMIVMHESGITETTINLDTPQFANTVFAGTQIVISEYSTAPKEFNIELRGNQQANAVFSANAEELVAAFQAGNYNFRVHRIDTSLLEGPGTRRKRVEKIQRKKEK